MVAGFSIPGGNMVRRQWELDRSVRSRGWEQDRIVRSFIPIWDTCDIITRVSQHTTAPKRTSYTALPW